MLMVYTVSVKLVGRHDWVYRAFVKTGRRSVFYTDLDYKPTGKEIIHLWKTNQVAFKRSNPKEDSKYIVDISDGYPEVYKSE